ncbi:MAG: DNA primase [Phycisphaerales bacterium]
MSDDRARVLDATDIVRLVGDHVALKSKGREFVGKCPFHDDHSPSMYVVPQKGIFYCFACGAGGNAIDFVMRHHKMEFVEALRFLAERSGVELTPRKQARSANVGEGAAPARAELVEANRFTSEFFRTVFRHAEHGKVARETCERRGISADMIEAFAIGAAPDRWDGLALTAQQKQVRLDALRALGLVKERERGGGVYDAFRNRLMFPIHDQTGRVIGFGGRRLNDEDEPKYINSPESPLFDKSKTLYGFGQAFRAIQDARCAIVVEGYIDVIACHQAGVKNVVATLGTALTPQHASVLQRVCDSVVLVFDGDDAGTRAADRAVEVFFAQPVDVRIATLAQTGAKDPDELLKREGGRALFDKAIADAADALEYRFARVREKISSLGLSARAKAVEDDIERLAHLGLTRVSPIRKRLVVRKLAGIAGVSEGEILEALKRVRAREPDPAPGSAAAALAALGVWEQAVGALLSYPGAWLELSVEERDLVVEGAYAAGPVGRVARAAAEIVARGEEASVSMVSAALEDDTLRGLTSRMVVEVERMTNGDRGRLLEMAREAARLERAKRALRRAGEQERGTVEGAGKALEELRRAREAVGGLAAVLPRTGGAS